MVLEKQAQIYKADQRGCSESEIFRRLCTFNFDDYRAISRHPFGALFALNDETLAAGNKIVRHLEENFDIILLPLVGGIVYKDSLGNQDIIGTEQIRIFSAHKDMSYEITNPYEEELVNYVQIWLRPDKPFFTSQSNQQDFNLSERNILVPLFEGNISDSPVLKTNTTANGLIGIFDGRKEGKYKLKNPDNGLFAFVINGAFEFENRLIESRDALSISGTYEAEFEALSENAILLILEIPLKR